MIPDATFAKIFVKPLLTITIKMGHVIGNAALRLLVFILQHWKVQLMERIHGKGVSSFRNSHSWGYSMILHFLSFTWNTI